METNTKQWSFDIKDMPECFTDFELETVRKLYLRAVSEFLFSHTLTEDKLRLAFDNALFAVRTFSKRSKEEGSKQNAFVEKIPKQEWDEYIRQEHEKEIRATLGDEYAPRNMK